MAAKSGVSVCLKCILILIQINNYFKIMETVLIIKDYDCYYYNQILVKNLLIKKKTRKKFTKPKLNFVEK